MDVEGLIQCTLFDPEKGTSRLPLKCYISPKHIIYMAEFYDEISGMPNHTTIYLKTGKPINIDEPIDTLMNCLHNIYG